MVLLNEGVPLFAAQFDLYMGFSLAAIERTRDQWYVLLARLVSRLKGSTSTRRFSKIASSLLCPSTGPDHSLLLAGTIS